MKMETDICAVTLNCWGLAYISKDRVPRMSAIAKELATGRYDFVFLQEVWTTEDYNRIQHETRDVLPYSHYFYSGVVGAGICIFSKSPIVGAFFHQWAVNGYMHKIQHGDWFGGKGIGLVEVLHRGLKINLYTAHLHAEYNRTNDEYLAHRVLQAYDTAQFIQITSRNADLVIVGGDLNTEPGDLSYQLIINTPSLRDTCFEANINEMYTNELASNSYCSAGALQTEFSGKRIDYILYKPGKSLTVKTTSCGTPWPNRVPGHDFSYSDHEAVVCDFHVERAVGAGKTISEEDSKCKEAVKALESSIEICTEALQRLSTARNIYLVLAFVCLALFMFSAPLQFSGVFYYLSSVVRVLILILTMFFAFMGTIWNRMEVNGVLAGKLSMGMELIRLNYNNYESEELKTSKGIHEQQNVFDH